MQKVQFFSNVYKNSLHFTLKICVFKLYLNKKVWGKKRDQGIKTKTKPKNLQYFMHDPETCSN